MKAGATIEPGTVVTTTTEDQRIKSWSEVRQLGVITKPRQAPSCQIHPEAQVDPSAHLSENTIIGKDAEIGPGAALGENVQVLNPDYA